MRGWTPGDCSKLRFSDLVIAGLLLLVAAPASAKPEYTRKTTKACAFCHQPPGYNLNEAGKYYADHEHSLKGYKPKPKPSHQGSV
jgi:hypothetical protein